MAQRLLIVEDTFQITGRGLVIVPGPLVAELKGPSKLLAEIRRPDGSVIKSELSVTHHFQTPPPKENRWACIFQVLPKSEVPIGSEIWVEENAEPFGQAGLRNQHTATETIQTLLATLETQLRFVGNDTPDVKYASYLFSIADQVAIQAQRIQENPESRQSFMGWGPLLRQIDDGCLSDDYPNLTVAYLAAQDALEKRAWGTQALE